MDLKKRYIFITLIFITLFIFLEIYLYQKSKENALTNAQNNIKELLLNYKALRTYISQNQREAVYDLQAKGSIGYHFFNPNLMSSSYGVRKVNQYYNQFRNSVDKKPIYIKFASNHPRNPKNKASVLESEVLKDFKTVQ